MNPVKNLPPGQRELGFFPRFGLSKYASRYRAAFDDLSLSIGGEVETPLTLTKDDLGSLTRVEQLSDFHCVTTWSKTGLHWSGFRFKDFYEKYILNQAKPTQEISQVVFRCQDGFRTNMLLSDLLADDVMLADTLNGEPLCSLHGAPLRLVVPAHYGYKNAKHVKGIEFWADNSNFKSPAFRFMNHPRARVALEERGRGLPGWIYRYLYRPLIRPTVKLFERYQK